MRYARTAVTRLLIAAGLCLLSVLFVDGPVARLFSNSALYHDHKKYAVGSLTLLVPLTLGAAFLVLWGRRGRFGAANQLIALAVISAVTALVSNNVLLKPLFGRTSIDEFLYWPSHYGFYFFKGGWSSNFPSGHMALVAAIATVVWQEFPRLRWISAAVVALATFLLLFGEWHFVSDLIAGALWGNLVALTIIALAERPTVSPGIDDDKS
jgi:membrane-associated phospholipid phosphatase